jgi:hypothetical protein
MHAKNALSMCCLVDQIRGFGAKVGQYNFKFVRDAFGLNHDAVSAPHCEFDHFSLAVLAAGTRCDFPLL